MSVIQCEPGWASTVTPITWITVQLGVRNTTNETMPSDEMKWRKKYFLWQIALWLTLIYSLYSRDRLSCFCRTISQTIRALVVWYLKGKQKSGVFVKREDDGAGPREDSPLGKENTVNTAWQPESSAALSPHWECVCVCIFPSVIIQERCLLFGGCVSALRV